MCDMVAIGFTYLQGQKAPLHMGLNLTTGKKEKRRVEVKNKGSAPKKKNGEQSMQHFLSFACGSVKHFV